MEDWEKLSVWARDEFMPTLPENKPGRKLVLLGNDNNFEEIIKIIR